MGLFNGIAAWFKPGASSGGAEAAVVTHLIEAVDPQLRSVPAYQERLLPAIDHATAYCERLMAAIPGPLDVTSALYSTDIRVRSLFPAVEDIGVSLGRSLAVRDGLRRLGEQANGSAYALLGMRRRRSTDAAFRDESADGNGPVPYADHTFRSLGAGVVETRKYLAEAAFDGMLIGFGSRWRELCRRQLRASSEQRVESELARAQPPEIGGGQPSVHEQHLRQAAQQPTPEHMLDALVEWLQFPEEQLRLEGTADAADLVMPVLIGRDRRHWPVCLTRISLSETADAIARETRVHRYILI